MYLNTKVFNLLESSKDGSLSSDHIDDIDIKESIETNNDYACINIGKFETGII